MHGATIKIGNFCVSPKLSHATRSLDDVTTWTMIVWIFSAAFTCHYNMCGVNNESIYLITYANLMLPWSFMCFL